MTETKRPILSGALRDQALGIVDEIVRSVIGALEHALDPSALPDILLLLATVSSRRELDVDFSQLAQRALDVARRPMRRALSGTLGYAVTMKNALDLLGAEIDVYTAAEAGLAASLAIEVPNESEFDLVHGSAGRLLFLSRRPNSPVNEASRERVCEHLAATRRRDDRGTRWERKGESRQDLSLAHGHAGVILGLAATISGGFGGARERAWLSEGIEFLLAQQNDPPTSHFFSSNVGSTFYRLAWCTGDLGMSLALWHAGEALNRADLRQLAVHMAELASRLGSDESKVVDASLCHGAAGAGLVFASLAHTMNSETLREAAVRWFSRVADHRRAKAPFGFQFKRSEDHFDDNLSLLEGVAGIALALERACTSLEALQDWPDQWGFR